MTEYEQALAIGRAMGLLDAALAILAVMAAGGAVLFVWGLWKWRQARWRGGE